MVWSHPGLNSRYKNSAGRVTQTSPWRLAAGGLLAVDKSTRPERLPAWGKPIVLGKNNFREKVKNKTAMRTSMKRKRC